jgi:hypothetical protein
MIREISNHDEDEGNMLSSGVPTPLDSFAQTGKLALLL